MGQVIRKDAAAQDIITDANKALTNATARGGRWKTLAESRLAPACAWFANIEAQRIAAEQTLAPLTATVATLNVQADKKIGASYDSIWNEVGRPRSDAALTVMFPDGVATYAQGDTAEQPDRMRVLVTLLGSGIHPRLSTTTANACAADLSAEADGLETAVSAHRKAAAKVKVLLRVQTALAKVVHAELINLKRLYKTEGFSEAEIHTVIPDRPSKTTKQDPSNVKTP